MHTNTVLILFSCYSAAIFRYLSKKFNVPEHWYPSTDLQRQARVDEYLHWHHSSTRMSAMMTFRHQVYIEEAFCHQTESTLAQNINKYIFVCIS